MGTFILLGLLLGRVAFGLRQGLAYAGICGFGEESGVASPWRYLESAPLDHPEVLVLCAWLIPILHRTGILLLGLRTNPLRLGVVMGVRTSVRELRFRGRVWVWIWFVLVVLGFVEPCEAQKKVSLWSEPELGSEGGTTNAMDHWWEGRGGMDLQEASANDQRGLATFPISQSI